MSSMIDFFEFKDVTLARATSADVEPVVSMVNQAYLYQEEATGVTRTSRERLRTQTEEGELYVAKQQDEIVASVYTRHTEGALHLGMLAVRDRMRRTGLAQAMMAAAEAYAWSLGAASLELEFLAQADWLQGYYERYGFATNGEVRQPREGIQLIHMSKPLDAAGK